MKVLGVLLFVVSGIIAAVMFSSASITSGVIVLVVAVLALLSCWFHKSPKKRAQEEAAKQKAIFESAQDVAMKSLIISRAVAIPDGGVFVDDKNRKFAVSINDSMRILDYSDLGEYELSEDGNSIAQGKGAATAIAGLAFGVMGALVAGAGSRKQQNTCTQLLVRAMINDLQNPQIAIPYISKEISKDSPVYKAASENANELVAILHYIAKKSAPATVPN